MHKASVVRMPVSDHEFSHARGWVWLALVSIVAFVSPLGLGAPSAFASDVKLGFVKIDRVLKEAPQAEAAEKRLEQEFAPRDRELIKRQQDLRAREDKLIKESDLLSDSQRRRQEDEIRRLRREVRRSQEEFREDFNVRRSEELSVLQRQVVEVINDLAKAEKFDAIFTSGVIYAGPKLDITEDVISRMARRAKSR